MHKLSFWAAVAGVSILANYGLEAVAARAKSPGLQRFVAFTHQGPGSS